ncbi:MAG: sigma-70 family RNA polymerase sigma factor [Deltaproteobacteria bacterium]|nr:sigma-70 family RNA polymerase sigma factor [Deltaproteobacteria bacterium]
MSEKQPVLDPEGWVDRHGDCMYRFALARLRSPDLAENAVQEAMLAGFEAKDGFSGRSSERTWLIGILKRKIYDHFRKSYRERPIEDVEAAREPTDDLFDEHGRWKVGPAKWGVATEAATHRAEFWKVLGDCLKGLPDRLSRVFTLREIDDLDTNEVCKVLSVTETNLWVMMHRARARLRRCMEANWFETENEKA